MAEDLLEIADDGTNDWMERTNANGDVTSVTANGEAIQRSKLRVDTRKWLLSKMIPEKYGDRVLTELTGKDGGPIKVADVSTTEAARLILATLREAAEKQE